MKYGKWQAGFYTISTWSEVNHRASPHQKGGWEMYLNQVPRRDRKSILQRVHVVRVPYDSPPYIPSSLGFIYKDESFFLFAAPEILLFKDALVRNEMSHLIANSPIASIANCYWWATKRGMIKRIKRFPDNKGCILMSLKTVSFFSWAILSLFRTWKYLLGIAFNAKEIQKILQYRVIVNQTLHL